MNRSSGRAALIAAVVALVFFVPASDAEAQSFQEDLQVILEQRPERPRSRAKQESDPAPIEVARVAEVKTMFAAAIRLYQGTLSATDMDVCNFWPSCSRFGAASLHQHGLIKGALLTADRLTRCNGLPSMSHHYHFDPVTGKFLDSVERYGFE